jgi:hypothetical protein
MMFRPSNVFFLIIFLFTVSIADSQSTLPVPVNIRRAYNNGTRSLSGKPGSRYWQNKADYNIKISFQPDSRLLSGTVSINYYNNSPDTLKRVLFKLFPNLFQKQAMRATTVAPEDLTNGVQIKSMQFNGKLLDSTKRSIKGTNMNVWGLTIKPHEQSRFDITYSYLLNKGSFIRTGQVDKGAFFIAYFFPRIAVYDDIDGWNEYPYTGPYEFYNDYGHFQAEITVPAEYIVWGTGELKNTKEVFQPKYAELIKKAEKQDGITDIITEADLTKADITKTGTKNTWKFEADQVTDVAFGISNHYVWKASSLIVDAHTGRRTRVDAVYNPSHPSYIPVVDYARKTTELISYHFPGIPFPYPHITIFEGLDAMEYPMMVNDLPFEKKQDAIEFTAHEVFHSLFPFYVGNNETKYSFMDEGWGTLAEFMLHPLIDSISEVGNNTDDVNRSAGSEQDVPIMTLTPQLLGSARYADKDMKPALGYLYVKEMLGDQLFKKALNYYIDQWTGRHPTPFDFFACMNAGAGKDLNWFWYNWFFTKDMPDLAIGRIHHAQKKYTVTISKVGNSIVPVHLNIIYSDGTKEALSRTIACWASGNRSIQLTFVARKTVRQLVLGAPFDADADKRNNTWKPEL